MYINKLSIHSFIPPLCILSQPSSGLGNLPKDSSTLPGPPVAVAVTVVPSLPLLRAILRKSPASFNAGMGTILAAVPSDEDLAGVHSAPSALAQAAATAENQRSGVKVDGGSRSPSCMAAVEGTLPPILTTPIGIGGDVLSQGPVTVWHGQRCTYELQLTNVGSAAIGSIAQLSVTNARGQPLKLLPRSGGHGRMPSSTSGVHLELPDGALAVLAAAMPLAPGATASVAVELYVGRPPFRDPFEETVLELQIGYTASLSNTTLLSSASSNVVGDVQSGAAPLSPRGGDDPMNQVNDETEASQLMGRRLSLPVHFRIQPTLQVCRIWKCDIPYEFSNI